MSNGANDLVSHAKALYAKEFTRDSTDEMRALLEQALGNARELAPEASAEAHALLAGVMICRYLNRWDEDGEAQLAAAEERIEEALRIAPGTALAHFAKGFLHRARGRHELALAAFRQTLEHNPHFTGAHAQAGAELMNLGRPQEALPHIERAIELDPNSSFRGMFYWNMGRILFLLAQYGDAIPWLEKSIAVQKDLWYTRLYLVSAHALIGQQHEAERALKEFNDLFPGYTAARAVETDEKVNPNHNLFVVIGRRNFHVGLRLAGMPEA
ncbi:MAG TPA: tetratricopeptide repeat protein [Stellaceae bacterium]|nr:tetratricopeptide repeat protein [Stellaceae bacterium]